MSVLGVQGKGSSLAHPVRLFFAVLFTLSTLFSFVLTPSAFADEEEDNRETIISSGKDYFVTGNDGQPNFNATLQKAKKDTDPDNSFAYVFNRLFGVYYINKTPNTSTGETENCQNKFAGTPLYHNCDVPGLMTELVQQVAYILTASGPVNAERESVTINAFGLPSDIPGGGAPVQENARQDKYTALELFGYSPKFTSYRGEWDNIYVLGSARAMANFGVKEHIKLLAHSAFNGVANAVRQGATTFIQGISEGNLLKATVGVFIAFWGGLTSAAVNTIMDTSDANVIATYGWYRVGYSKTLYGGRELSEDEVAINARARLLHGIQATQPAKAEPPAELVAIQNGMPDPKENISKCTLTSNQEGATPFEYGKTDKAPGISEENCKKEAENRHVKPDKTASGKETVEIIYTASWSVDGNQKKELLVDWVNTNSNVTTTGEKYGITCKPATDEGNRAGNIAAMKSCWQEQYPPALEKATIAEQEKANTQWSLQLLNPLNFAKYIIDTPGSNFNAPYNRFVCTDKNGKDIMDGAVYRMAYDHQGKLNPGCTPLRAPIKGGLLGSGDQADAVSSDSRHISHFGGITGLIFGNPNEGSGNMGITIAGFLTRISNALLDLSFSPILDNLGLKPLIIDIIVSLRTSVFFPLITLLLAVAGMLALIKTITQQEGQLRSLFSTVFAAFIGAVMLFSPATIIDVVDRLPTVAERTVLSVVFGTANTTTDQLCTTETAHTPEKASLDDVDSPTYKYSFSYPVRSVMCENWRIFVFTPWVNGQFGTSYENLYAKETGKSTAMQNTNGNLVGDASVYLGGGVTEKNWALYQLKATSSGTASYSSTTPESGAVSRDFYRLVDLQAGPNNGEGADSRFIEAWSGNASGRGFVGVGAVMAAFAGLVAIGGIAITKIYLSFISVVLLGIMPFMLLTAIIPNTRFQFKKYAMNIVAIMLQRVFLALILAIMLRVLVGIATSSTSYFGTFIGTFVMCIVMFKYRKEMLDMVMQSATAATGGAFVKGDELKEKIAGRGSFMGNRVHRINSSVKGVATGAVGGFAVGGVNGAFQGARQNYETLIRREGNRQRRTGFGSIDTVLQGLDAGRASANENLMNSDAGRELMRDIYKDSGAESYDTHIQDQIENNSQTVVTSEGVGKRTSSGDYYGSPQPHTLNPSQLSTRQLRKVSKAAKKQRELKREVNSLNGERPKISLENMDEVRRGIAHAEEQNRRNQEMKSELKKLREGLSSAHGKRTARAVKKDRKKVVYQDRFRQESESVRRSYPEWSEVEIQQEARRRAIEAVRDWGDSVDRHFTADITTDERKDGEGEE